MKAQKNKELPRLMFCETESGDSENDRIGFESF